MLEDVERGDQVETPVRKGNSLGSPVGKIHAGPPRHARGTAHVDIAGGDAAEFEKGLGHNASSGTDVDDAGRRPQARAQERSDDLSAAPGPPVEVFVSETLAVEG